VNNVQGLEDQQTKVIKGNIVQDLGWVVIAKKFALCSTDG
jgi:hypothetical protein